MQTSTSMDWLVITTWGLMAGLTACGVVAFEWVEARVAGRRQVERPRGPL